MTLKDGLVAYYELDGNSEDSVASFDGTDTDISYDASYGKISQGARFNGSSSKIVVGDDSSLDITGDISIAVWVRTSSLVANMTLVSKSSGGTTNIPYEFRFNNSTDGYIILLRAGSSDYGFATANTAVSNNTWTLVGVSVSGTTPRFYINGSVVTATQNRSYPTTITSNSQALDIGSRNGNLFYNGDADSIGIWSRSLTDDEWSYLYNNGDGITYSSILSYDITQLDSFTITDTSYVLSSKIEKIDDAHFLFVGRNSSGYGAAFIYEVDGSYNISQLEYFTFGASVSEAQIAIIDSTHFAVSYKGADGDGFISTFSIDGSYQITELDNLEHDTADCNHNSLALLDSTHLVLAYAGPSSDGFVKVFTIDGSYQITQTSVLEHDIAYGIYNSLVVIDSTHFAIAYVSTGSSGQVSIFSVDGSYNITELEQYGVQAGTTINCSMVLLDSSHLALYYHSGVGIIEILSFDGSYNITDVSAYSQTNISASRAKLILLDNTHLVLYYSADGNSYQRISILEIDDEYNIFLLSTYSNNSYYPVDCDAICKISNSKLITAVWDSSTFIETFSIASYAEIFVYDTQSTSELKLNSIVGKNVDTQTQSDYQSLVRAVTFLVSDNSITSENKSIFIHGLNVDNVISQELKLLNINSKNTEISVSSDNSYFIRVLKIDAIDSSISSDITKFLVSTYLTEIQSLTDNSLNKIELTKQETISSSDTELINTLASNVDIIYTTDSGGATQLLLSRIKPGVVGLDRVTPSILKATKHKPLVQ